MVSEKKNGPDSVHLESAPGQTIDPSPDNVETGTTWKTSLGEAQAANAREHDMSVAQAVALFPWAILWSLVPCMAIVMEGYDANLMTSFFAYPAFKMQFGEDYPGKGYQVSGAWQAALGAVGNLGCFVGALINGYLVDKLGFKKVFLMGQILMIAFIFIPFFGKSVALQVVGRILCGIPWGIFATLGPAYTSELCPMALRAYLTAFVNMFFVIGQLISAGVLRSFISVEGEWSYRIPFALQWMWPGPLLLLGCFMPESPWWHVRKGQYDAALKVVNRLTAKPDSEIARQAVAMMIHTDNLEKHIEQGSYIECFRGTNARRTEIACVSLAGQVFAGLAFAYSPTYFFEQAGMGAENAYALGLGGAGLAFVGTAISGGIMHFLGRRIMYVTGMCLMSAYLLIIGCLTPASGNNAGILWTQSVLCVVWLFTFSLTVGPMSWLIPPEVSSTRLRSKTIVLARNSYYLVVVVAYAIEPYMMNPTAWNWRGYTGFFWFVSAFLTFIWGFFRLPETKGHTFEELDIMFEARVPTRQFKHCQVNAYAEGLSLADRITKRE